MRAQDGSCKRQVTKRDACIHAAATVLTLQEMREHTKPVTDLDWSLENHQLLTSSGVCYEAVSEMLDDTMDRNHCTWSRGLLTIYNMTKPHLSACAADSCTLFPMAVSACSLLRYS